MGKHAPEFETFDGALQRFGIAFDARKRGIVVLVARDVVELTCIAHARAQTFQRTDDAFERLAFFSEVLRALGLVPDIRIFGELDDLAQAYLLLLEVKDTSAVRRRGCRRRRGALRSD
jgi:hypothetical protein